MQKPESAPDGGPAPADCSERFIARDALSSWQADAVAALRSWSARSTLPATEAVPTVVVGVSEGAEVLPAVALSMPNVMAIVAISHPGLDPWELGRLQAESQGHHVAWRALEDAVVDADRSNGEVLQGRTLRYWRELRTWRVEQPLRDTPWPLLQVSGGDDALMPSQGYARFGTAMAGRAVPVCVMRLPGADHGLRNADESGLKKVWALIEDWARAGAFHCPESVHP